MRFRKGKWIKYSNKILPRYVRAHWETKLTNDKYLAFSNWERAMIFEQIYKLNDRFRDLDENG